MSDRSWFSMRTTTSWSKLLVAWGNTGREPDESPGVRIGRRAQAENTRTTKRRVAIRVGGGCGRAEERIESTNVGTVPYLSGRYMPTRTRLSQLVAAMRNTAVGLGNSCSRIRNRDDIAAIERRRRVGDSPEGSGPRDPTCRPLPLLPRTLRPSSAETAPFDADGGGA